MQTHDLLRTRDRYHAASAKPERGTKYWTRAELPKSTWFVVEACVKVPGAEFEREVHTFIAPTFSEAVLTCIDTPHEWVAIHAFIRAASIFPEGHVFDTVSEAFRIHPSGGTLLRFRSGLIFIDGGKSKPGTSEIANATKVFPMCPKL